jgi:hypothetical protein
MNRLTAFRRLHLVTEQGELLGHVHDVRCRSTGAVFGGGADLEAYAIVYGRLGWLERFGLRDAATQVREWEDVVRIEGDRIVVRNVPRRTGTRNKRR